MSDPRLIDRLFSGLQDRLRASLTTGRDLHDHGPTKGAGAEANWLAMLEQHLPSRYRVATGFVVDRKGRSDQIDVIIFDRHYCPLLFTDAGFVYVPAESVYAVFEVKQEVTRETVLYAGDKIASVRALERTTAPIPHAGGVFPAKEPPRIIGGLLALASGWTPLAGAPLRSALSDASADGRLDMICGLDAGSVRIECDADVPTITISQPGKALSFLLLTLVGRLQAAGTVPAMDLDAWGESLEA